MSEPQAPAPYAPYPSTSGYPTYPTSQFPAQGQWGPPPSKAMATWALVLAVIPTVVGSLVAIGLALEVLSRSRDGRDHGKGMAIAALVIAPLWALAIGALIVAAAASEPDRGPSGALTSEGDVSVFELHTGDCMTGSLTPGSVGPTTHVIPCSRPHSGEVFAVFDLADGDYPGRAEILRLATGGCTKRSAAYLGGVRPEAGLRLNYYYPLAETWGASHRVTCIAVSPGLRTGSLQGSGALGS